MTGLPARKGEEAEIIVLFKRYREQRGMTMGELLKTDLVGLWKDRTDIGDSVEFTRQLRRSIRKRRD